LPSNRPSPMPATQPTKRALILKLGAIGDVVMAIPAARLLADNGYTITWVVGRAAAPVLQLYPWLNLIVVDDAPLLRGSITQRLRAFPALWRAIPSGEYDLCATLYFDPRYKLLTLPIRAKRKLLLTQDNRELSLLPGRHHTDEYARILLGLKDEARPQQLAPVRPATMPPSPIPRTEKPRVVLVPAGAKNLMRDDALRRWPIENYVAVAAALLQRGIEVLLAGGPQDTWASAAFARLAINDQIGKHALPETIGLFDSADVVCTHDTGPLHLAGITNAAIVTVFGPVDPHGRLPQRANSVALWGGEGFACRPCYDGRDYAPCPNNLCMQQITPAMVVKEIEAMIAARSKGEALPPRVRVPKHTPVQITGAR
jgi:heptosyltransferase-2